MENIFKVKKTRTIVLLCGVEAEIRGLEGKHQALITTQDKKKREAGLKTMLWDCLIRLGDSTSLTEEYIDKLTSYDRKFLLWEIRKLSNPDTKEFIFDYEFPTKGNQKLKQRYNVDFTNETFPISPALWVKEQMFELYKEEIGVSKLTPQQESQALLRPIPIIYDTYDEMLSERLRNTLTLPECGVEIFWEIATGKDENKIAKIAGYETNSHTQLYLRTPRYVNKELSKEKEVIQPVPLDDLSNTDIEALRRNIMEIEGNVDSMIVVQSDEDPNQIAQVDLLQTPAFFFASLAI